ncbi:MAG TPA: iron chelate uptake ABC transporter family permease subunit [Verrucomicrobiae bacterium]|jgi:zinc/manganese transport system permease protein|nr:iron chelate uptake ABC transporter family permease subunit [Verrucomicrobiae bacterium]
MSALLDIIQFMLWPLLACLLLPPILVYLGLHIIRREIIFVDLALAQVAALGTCLAILVGHHEEWQSYAWSLSFTLVGAAIFTLSRTKKGEVPQEALIGIIYVVAAAAGILLLSRSPEGVEELQRTLVGDVLLVTRANVLRTFGIYLVIAAIHMALRKKFIRLSFEPDQAVATGMRVRLWDFLFYCLFGIIVTSFVQIGGVLLTFSYLIVPAVCATFLAARLATRLIVGWGIATISSIVALYLSFRLDLPTGAAVVCVLGAALLLTIGLTSLKRG